MTDISAAIEMVMSDKSESEIEADEVIDTFDELVRQRDALRVELETLQHAHADVLDALSLRSAENERLRAKEVELREELVRLRGEIWDLTHPSA